MSSHSLSTRRERPSCFLCGIPFSESLCERGICESTSGLELRCLSSIGMITICSENFVAASLQWKPEGTNRFAPSPSRGKLFEIASRCLDPPHGVLRSISEGLAERVRVQRFGTTSRMLLSRKSSLKAENNVDSR